MSKSLYSKERDDGAYYIDDGWVIYKEDENDHTLDLIAVVDTETMADTLIAALDAENPDMSPLMASVNQVLIDRDSDVSLDDINEDGLQQLYDMYLGPAIDMVERELRIYKNMHADVKVTDQSPWAGVLPVAKTPEQNLEDEISTAVATAVVHNVSVDQLVNDAFRPCKHATKLKAMGIRNAIRAMLTDGEIENETSDHLISRIEDIAANSTPAPASPANHHPDRG